jgi:hypothetical protein
VPTLKRVLASGGQQEENIGRDGRLQCLQKATGTGQCAAGSDALLCAPERGARYRCVAGSARFSFGRGQTGSRHLHHLAARLGRRAAGRWSGPGRRDTRSRRGVSGTGRGAHVMGCCPEKLGPFRAPWSHPWRAPRESTSGELARWRFSRANFRLKVLGHVVYKGERLNFYK